MFTIDSVALQSASRGPILTSLLKMNNKAPRAWLPHTHAAKRGELPPTWSGLNRVATSEAIDAVALAAPQHCMDGWTYISRSLSAMLAGDYHSARHLSYYAQLRSALSLLANMGVGIFNGVNFAVVDATTLSRIDLRSDGTHSNRGMGTHEIVWKALDAWSSSPATSTQFLELIRIRGESLKTCIESLWPGFSPLTSATSLIRAWGLDLRRGAQEHKFRNISSYAPHAVNPLQTNTARDLDFIEELWTYFEPSGGQNFDYLDKHLLRLALWEQHFLVDRGPRSQGAMEKRYDQLPPAVAAIASKDFLLGTTEPTLPRLMQLARSPNKPASPVEMIARALLLLRAATALSYENLRAAGINCSAGALRPWLDQVAVERGFWKTGQALANTVDLYADVALGLADLQSSKSSRPSSLADWLSKKDRGIPAITEMERIGVWSFTG